MRTTLLICQLITNSIMILCLMISVMPEKLQFQFSGINHISITYQDDISRQGWIQDLWIGSSNVQKGFILLILSEFSEINHEHDQKEMSRGMRKPTFCICKNKAADQYFSVQLISAFICYIDSTIPLLSKSEISSLESSCSCTARFVSDLVINPENRFSGVAAQMILTQRGFLSKP